MAKSKKAKAKTQGVANGSEITYEMAEIFFKDLMRTPGLKFAGKTYSPTYIEERW